MSQSHQVSKTYHILPGPKMGVVTPDYLETVAKIAREYSIPFIKITSAQRFAIAGHAAENVQNIWHGFGKQQGPAKPAGIHYIQACPGVRWCKYGRQDALALGEKVEEKLMQMALPAKTKVGISGCPMNCCESFVRDVGIFGKKNGWSLVFGGNGGGLPRIGDIIATDLDDDQVVTLTGKCLAYYAAHARKRERTARFMERSSLEDLKRALTL